jgi:hypothetical protein
MNDGETDAFLQEILDEAMAPYRGRVPEEQLEMMRRVLKEEMREDATAMRLLSAARPRSVPHRSGDVPVESATPAEAEERSAEIVPLRKRSAG